MDTALYCICSIGAHSRSVWRLACAVLCVPRFIHQISDSPSCSWIVRALLPSSVRPHLLHLTLSVVHCFCGVVAHPGTEIVSAVRHARILQSGKAPRAVQARHVVVGQRAPYPRQHTRHYFLRWYSICYPHRNFHFRSFCYPTIRGTWKATHCESICFPNTFYYLTLYRLFPLLFCLSSSSPVFSPYTMRLR